MQLEETKKNNFFKNLKHKPVSCDRLNVLFPLRQHPYIVLGLQSKGGGQKRTYFGFFLTEEHGGGETKMKFDFSYRFSLPGWENT